MRIIIYLLVGLIYCNNCVANKIDRDQVLIPLTVTITDQPFKPIYGKVRRDKSTYSGYYIPKNLKDAIIELKLMAPFELNQAIKSNFDEIISVQKIKPKVGFNEPNYLAIFKVLNNEDYKNSSALIWLSDWAMENWGLRYVNDLLEHTDSPLRDWFNSNEIYLPQTMNSILVNAYVFDEYIDIKILKSWIEKSAEENLIFSPPSNLIIGDCFESLKYEIGNFIIYTRADSNIDFFHYSKCKSSKKIFIYIRPKNSWKEATVEQIKLIVNERILDRYE